MHSVGTEGLAFLNVLNKVNNCSSEEYVFLGGCACGAYSTLSMLQGTWPGL